MEQSPDVQHRIKEACALLSGGQNEQAFGKLGQLRDEGKVQFQITKEDETMKEGKCLPGAMIENAEQQVTQDKWAAKS